MTTTTSTPIEQIVEAWRNGATCAEIAAACEPPVSRQRISQRLIEAGYSPAERRARKIAARDEQASEYRAQRAASLARRAEQRDFAVGWFLEICAEYAVSPQTLGQYVSRSGPYARDTKTTPYRYASENQKQLGRGRLPGRQTTEGKLLAERVADVSKPWSAKHISTLADARWRR